jgi:hypothetical protein
MNSFFEFWIGRMLWVWMPLYSLYRAIKDIIEIDLKIDE